MLRLLILSCVVSTFLLPFTYAAAPGTVPEEGRRVHLTFDRSEGEPVKFVPSLETAEGVDGKGAFFGLNRNYGIVDLPKDFYKGDFTFSAWFNMYTGYGAPRLIASKTNTPKKEPWEWQLVLDPSNRVFAEYNSGERQERLIGRQTIEPGHWYQVVFTVSGKTAILYLNGKELARRELRGQLTPSASDTIIGGSTRRGKSINVFEGILDEVLIYDRALSAEEVAGMYAPVDKVHKECNLNVPDPVVLWTGGEYPSEDQFHRLKNVRFAKVKARQPEKDTYTWHHGGAIIRFKDKFYASTGAHFRHENTPGERVLVTTSPDGLEWSPCTIMNEDPNPNVGRSHGVFLVHDGKLWAFHTLFFKRGTPEAAKGGAFPGLKMEAYILDEATGKWENKGVVAEGIWPLHEPIKMDNGNWIVVGCDEDWRASVAISQGDDLLHWKSQKVRSKDNWFTESNVWVDGKDLTLVIRNDTPIHSGFKCAAVATSNDYGETWTEPLESNMPMTTSKPFCGVLSTGHRFLIDTLRPQGGRGSMEIALSRPGEKTLSKVYRIRTAREPAPEGAFNAGGFSYPHAREYDGKLYVIYSVGVPEEDLTMPRVGANNNHIELAIIPVSELTTD